MQDLYNLGTNLKEARAEAKAEAHRADAERLRKQWRNLWPELEQHYARVDDIQFQYEMAVARTKEQARRAWSSFVGTAVACALVSVFLALVLLFGA